MVVFSSFRRPQVSKDDDDEDLTLAVVALNDYLAAGTPEVNYVPQLQTINRQ